MFDRLRWLTIVVPVLVVSAIELLSDTVLDPYLPFPWDTVLIALVTFALAAALSRIAFDRIDRLTVTLATRNVELERRVATARALHRVSGSIASLRDLDEILPVIVDQARYLLGSDVALLLLEGADGGLVPRATSGPAEAVHDDGGASATEVDLFIEPAYSVARLAAPLQRGGRTIGLLVVGARTARAFDVDDVETLASLASHAAIAIENDRLNRRLRELAVVEERERIAREMHDWLAQVLGYVNTKSQAVEELLVTGRVPEARVHLAELAASARSIYADIREAILGLRSPIAPGVGLVGAIEGYAARFAEASKLAVVVNASDDAASLPLASDVEDQVFRITQEALSNVRKHAAARRVVVGIDVDAAALIVSIADDGRGFDAAKARDLTTGDRRHYGLSAMAERAASIGATVTWSAAETGGTVVRVAWPLVPADSSDVPGVVALTPDAPSAVSIGAERPA